MNSRSCTGAPVSFSTSSGFLVVSLMPPVVSVWSLSVVLRLSFDFFSIFTVIFLPIVAIPQRIPFLSSTALYLSQSIPHRTLTCFPRPLLVLPTLCHVRRLFVALAEFRSKAGSG
ncbi:hypothetical protein BO94DRAFT_232856 [Aspergillus sclerotioniger CBS 115572]|uniref:Uncharacterized protein n=1 Tax=Aspergillus sclerotioniger CBS 115572 TaxID=1450535 RepID=A0A317VHI3_9EURO|nr:hypothetical protein BO94DRAFT_232856 [Aspergillus sclerotioniger CBS 115572]PWY73773.1 hypothetical protein BO94DRAFT_232856 [Aspergillus sclerotioniger CBS 115572]